MAHTTMLSILLLGVCIVFGAAQSPAFYDPQPAVSYAHVLVPPSYSNSSFATRLALAQRLDGLRGRTLRVSVGTGTVTDKLLGPDNFMRVLPGSPAIAAWQALAPGEFIRVRDSDITGLLKWLIDEVCAVGAGNCRAEYYWPKLPAGVGTSDTGLSVVYMLDALKMDAVARDVSVQANRRPFMRYSNSFQTFSFVIVAPRALILKPTLSAKLWTWVTPFSWDLWLVLASSVIFSAFVFYILELESSADGNDFSHFVHKATGDTNHRHALGHSLYLSALAVTTIADHTPTTFPARIFTLCKTFALWVVMAAYLANFAAGLANRPIPFQPIQSFDSFSQLGQPACIRNLSSNINFMRTVLPAVPYVVAGPMIEDVLDGILRGDCVGGIGADTEFRWAMGGADTTEKERRIALPDHASVVMVGSALVCSTGPSGVVACSCNTTRPRLPPTRFPQTGKYCPLDFTGEPSLTTYGVAIPFTTNTTLLPESALEGFNIGIDQLITSGNYSTFGANVFIPNERPTQQCADYLSVYQGALAADSTLVALDSSDMAGIFILQACGAVVAVLWHSFNVSRRWHKRHRTDRLAALNVREKAPPSRREFIAKEVAAEVLQVLERFDLEPDRQGSGSLRAPTAEVSSAL